MMTSVPAVTITNLRVARGGRPVLDTISCQIAGGSVTGLLGPSGCGKSTLMRAIVGVQVIESGAIRVLGEPAGAPRLRRRVGYVTQAPSVYADLSVRENLRYFAGVLGVGQARIAEVIETVSLQEQADRVTANLSAGQRARASLATALLGEPELLVLDEPTVGLDPVLRRDLWAHFRRLASSGVTLLVSSHVMDEAEHCDELLLMRDGELITTETPAELRRDTGQQNLEGAFLALIEQQEQQ
jgi:ABC-2 type transport system ATP-binding protein